MTFLYLDASAWLKRYYLERGSDRVHELLRGDGILVCSVLGLVEVIATLARKRKAHEISVSDFEAKMVEIERDWQRFVQIELTLSGVEKAKEVAARLALRGSDAIHLAALLSLASRVSEFGHRVVLVASDKELTQAGESSGIEVFDPEVANSQ